MFNRNKAGSSSNSTSNSTSTSTSTSNSTTSASSATAKTAGTAPSSTPTSTSLLSKNIAPSSTVSTNEKDTHTAEHPTNSTKEQQASSSLLSSSSTPSHNDANRNAPPPLLTRQLTSHLDVESEVPLESNEASLGELHGVSQDSSSRLLENEQERKGNIEADEEEPSAIDPLEPKDVGSIGTPCMKNARADLRCGIATDPGGGNVNQDDGEVFEVGENQEVVVFSVFDGHGRELGELASRVAKESVRQSFFKSDALDRLRRNPKEMIVDVFKQAHEAIRTAFRDKYIKARWEVMDTQDGYIIKRQNRKSNWTCTHGGTTATVAIIIDGWRLIVANVGDSTALWSGLRPDGSVVYKELSAEHSPESPSEYIRCRDFRPAKKPVQKGVKEPDMRFVYDAPAHSKNQCPAVFRTDPKDKDQVQVTGHGNYYKNVRNEWASLVTTPPNAQFQDALAFTRSLGDLHLHVYGVSAVPEIVEYDLTRLHRDIVKGWPSSQSGESGKTHGRLQQEEEEEEEEHRAAADPNNVSMLLVCTDGVWDNWKFEDIAAKMLKGNWPADSFQAADAQGATDELMKTNIALAKSHFGPSADNMTAILSYIYF